jgi:tetratricopeptide (TPR) repeat protein
MQETSLQEAMTLKTQGKYSEAALILESALAQNITIADSFAITSLVFCYAKIGKHQKIVELREALSRGGITIEQVNIATAWALFNLHFKPQKNLSAETAVELLEGIAKLFPQNQALHPLPLAIFKYLASNNLSTPAFKVHLLEMLKPELLNSEPKLLNGKDRPLSSDRETFYSHYSKALFNDAKYDQCAEVCQKAMTLKLTLRVWFERRYAMCLAKTGRMQEAFDLYLKLSAQKGEWYIFFETALAAYRLQDYANADSYAIKALSAPGKIEAKIHLWDLLRNLASYNKQFELAIELLSLIAAIRLQMHWSMSAELQRELASYNIVPDKLPAYKDIHRSIKQKLLKSKAPESTHQGRILRMLPDNVAGFISANNQSYYFRASDCHNFAPTVNQKVSFGLVDSFDVKKQQKSQRAVRILKLD